MGEISNEQIHDLMTHAPRRKFTLDLMPSAAELERGWGVRALYSPIARSGRGLGGEGALLPIYIARSGRGLGGEGRICDRSACGNLAGLLRCASIHATVMRARANTWSPRCATCSNRIEQRPI